MHDPRVHRTLSLSDHVAIGLPAFVAEYRACFQRVPGEIARQVDDARPGALASEVSDSRFESVEDGVSCRRQFLLWQQSDTEAIERGRFAVFRRFGWTGCMVSPPDIDDGLDRPRHEPDGIERLAQWRHAFARDISLTRLEADDAAHRRGDTNRPAGVRPQSDVRESRRNRDGTATRTAARYPVNVCVPRVPRCAGHVIRAPAAHREFDHCGLGIHMPPGSLQRRDRGRRCRCGSEVVAH